MTGDIFPVSWRITESRAAVDIIVVGVVESHLKLTGRAESVQPRYDKD